MWILVLVDQEKEVKKLNLRKLKKGDIEIVKVPLDFPWDELREMDWEELCERLDIYPWYDGAEVYVSDWDRREGVIHFSLR